MYEPATEAEYFYSRKQKATTAFMGLVLLGLSSWMLFTQPEQLFVSLLLLSIGLVLVYSGIKGWRDKNSRLKIARSGLWTQKLGFVSWNDVLSAKVEEEKAGRTTQLFLHIHLKGTSAEEPGQPDEKVLLSDLEDKATIEAVIRYAMTQYRIAHT